MHILVAFQAFLHLLLLSFNTSATRLPLVHRDHNLSLSHEVEARMKRDAMRVASLTRRLADGFETGLQYIAKEYWAEVGVGTPPQKQRLMIDTGSDVSWVKFRCDSCKFDPTISTSFVDVYCENLTCYEVSGANWNCSMDLACTYMLIYADGTKTQGIMAMENITIGNTTVQNVPIGCSFTGGGVFSLGGSDGILALGGGPTSFARKTGVFSYCLGNWTSPGWLEFGYANVPRDAKWAPLISNPKVPSDYYINLVEISVGGEVLLGLPANTLQVNPDTGEGGMVLDTGTWVTLLAQGVYEALRDKFREKMSNYKTVDGISILDTCYDLHEYGNLGSIHVPAVLFKISSRGMDPPTITLEANNVLVEMDYTDITYCLAFASSGSSFNILGSLQQHGTQITIDERGYVGFGPDTC